MKFDAQGRPIGMPAPAGGAAQADRPRPEGEEALPGTGEVPEAEGESGLGGGKEEYENLSE
jgi:hypothetical protein